MPRVPAPLPTAFLIVCLTLLATAAPAAIVQQVRFEQYSYQDVLSLETTPPSGIGGCVVTFEADPALGYLNVAAFAPGSSSASQWVVRNLRLHPLGEAAPVETITCQFPLSLLGLEPGLPAGPVEYALAILPEPLLDVEAPAWLASVTRDRFAVFEPALVQVGRGSLAWPETRATALPDQWFSVSALAGVDTVKSNIGCTMTNMDLDGGRNPNDVNACAPASAANSLTWLKDKHDEIDFPHDTRSVMEQISRLAGRVGPVGIWPKDLAKAKLDFIEAHQLPIHVKIQDVSSAGAIASTSGRSSAEDKDTGAGSWPTRKFIFEEARKGEDVEVIVSWYYWDAATNQWKPSNFSHALVLTGAGTKAGADWVKLKDDDDQHRPGGQLERDSGVTDMGWGIELPGLRITIPSGPGAGQEGRAFVSAVVSESKDMRVTPPPGSETMSGYCQYIKRTVPKGGTISFTFPEGGEGRCYNATLTVREPGPHGHDLRKGPWNLNRGQTRTWRNTYAYPVVVMLHNDDYAGGQTPYPAFDVGIAITDSTGAAPGSTAFNPEVFGGISFGGTDGSSQGYSPTWLGPSVLVGPVIGELDLATVPSRLAAVAPGTRDLQFNVPINGWNRYWEELGLVIDVLDVAAPGTLLVDCPSTGQSTPLVITAPGRYELPLGHMPPAPQFDLLLSVVDGLDVTLDAIGVPSYVGVPVSDVPAVAPAVRLAAAAPNPFNPRTVVAFELPRAMPVRLAVYDLRGRLVAVLAEGTWPAGRHEAAWDGRDAGGHPVAAGAYVCRLEADGLALTTALALVK